LRKKSIKNPDEILYSACSFMRYWTGLYTENTQQVINEGVDLMLRTTIKLLGKQNKKPRLKLTNGRTSIEESEDHEDDAEETT
jgi:hypothetical protein